MIYFRINMIWPASEDDTFDMFFSHVGEGFKAFVADIGFITFKFGKSLIYCRRKFIFGDTIFGQFLC
ncbi:hypothetical protein SDC9_205506 [bioreactor metagenome]|uniref:Uncharacterized protein n=1 Tax=bioreactor metagenome TaxID=1076179 RepID=A0A645J3X6_9ZZZZ